jgi:hypothetical protein
VSIISFPFTARSSSATSPYQKVLGLSKFARIAHRYAHELQIQERLVVQIGNEIMKVTGCGDVAVIGRGEHSCMVARGIKTPALMTSSVLFGRFKHDAAMRAEFLSIAGFLRSEYERRKEPQWVEPNEGQPVDVDLGDGHTLTWTNYEGERVGGIIRHTKSPELMANQLAHAGSPEHVFPWCDGAFWIRATSSRLSIGTPRPNGI